LAKLARRAIVAASDTALTVAGAAHPADRTETAMPARLAFVSLSASIVTAFSIAASAAPATPQSDAPIVVAQAPASSAPMSSSVADVDFPPEQARVRAAAKESPQALRLYIQRTRNIHQFQYKDFAPKS
jgi:hypothetical protein